MRGGLSDLQSIGGSEVISYKLGFSGLEFQITNYK